MLYTPASTTTNTYFSSHVPVSTGRQVPIIAGQSSRTQESIRLFPQPGPLAGRLPGSSRSYRSPVGKWVNSGAVAIIKTYKTHIYSCAQKWLYANAKLRTVKRLVARMFITDNVRMSRSWFTVKDTVHTKCVINTWRFLKFKNQRAG
jgi:hypothetical protein